MNQYKQLPKDELSNHLDNFIVRHWSHSRLEEFCRNEASFERSAIYNEYGQKSSNTVAGNAYHEALKYYFLNRKAGKIVSFTYLTELAQNYVRAIPSHDWRLLVKTPSVAAAQLDAIKSATKLIQHFLEEIDTYMEDVVEILFVETKLTEWITVCGEDIPLPCHSISDVGFRLKDGRIAVVDHKSRQAYTQEDELCMTSGQQAIIYTLSVEERYGYDVDEVWIIENKAAKNKDGGPQLRKTVITMDESSRTIYEAFLYDSLSRLISAVQDENYVYLINNNDKFVSLAEIYEFKCRLMMSDVESFNIDDGNRAMIAARLKRNQLTQNNIKMINPKAIERFRANAIHFVSLDYTNSNMTNSEKIEHLLTHFNCGAIVEHEITENWSASNTYLLRMKTGVKINSVYAYRLDIANALGVQDVRIGKKLHVHDNGTAYLTIESNKERTDSLYYDASLLQGLKIPMGRTNFNELVCWDLQKHSTPHTLVCGATGSGKSVFVKSTIEYAIHSQQVDIIILDPKYEFSEYSNHSGVSVFNDIDNIENEMKRLVDMMQQRAANPKGNHRRTMIVFDEFADAVNSARSGAALDQWEEIQEGYYAKHDENGDPIPKMKRKKVGKDKSLEENLKMILQKGRSLGFNVIAATQRASVKVISGDAKVNFPLIVCFRVPKEIDSKVVLDEAGAETLAGYGDGLISSPEYPDIVRFQGFYKP